MTLTIAGRRCCWALERIGKKGLTRTEVRQAIFPSHGVRLARVNNLRDELLRFGLVTITREPTAGRPREVWRYKGMKPSNGLFPYTLCAIGK